ncbi:MAG: glycerate kinase [Deltaproteobacteria bacterium]|nr:glycerate kinase [Deltaproteobacteria bacterium]
MGDVALQQLREAAGDIFRASLAPVDPYGAVKNFVRVQGHTLILGKEGRDPVELDMERFDRISIVGGGKATAPMARAVEDLLKAQIKSGMITVKYGFTDTLKRTRIVEAGHPVPDEAGVEGTRTILDFLKKAGESDLIFSLISGGGSALLCQPAAHISLAEKQALTRALLECGASIDEINTVRKHISASKGGQMARAAAPATVVNLMLSDVVGDKMDVIASGPFVPDPSTFDQALSILKKYGIEGASDTVYHHVEAGVKGEINETPKADDPVFKRVFNFIVGSNIMALKAAAQKAEALGYAPLILSSLIEGETRDVALFHTVILKEMLRSQNPIKPPACVISGGETTVTIKGKGLGGRNQEFCLAAALDLTGLDPRVVVLSGGTDGNDGPTDAAGAVVDPHTVARGKALGLDAGAFLDDNNAYHYFEKTGELLITGPTNTNVMDVRLLLVK